MPIRTVSGSAILLGALAAAAIYFDALPVAAITIETVPVGNPGNVPVFSQDGYPGAVEYDYRIGKYEVTNAQYVEFLNSVDNAGANKLALYSTSMSTDALGGIIRNVAAVNGRKYEVKAGRESNPVVFVSFYDALRFTNWLHNGQGTSGTENGAYMLLGGTPRPSNFQSLSRNIGATWWLPNYNEVYKAAYHKNDAATANYWEYPLSSSLIPSSDQPPGSDAPSPSNTANFFQDDQLINGYNDGHAVTASPSSSSTQNYLTNVGAYALSRSPYGAYDLGGNVAEWCQADTTSSCGAFGGHWASTAVALRAPGNGFANNPLSKDRYTGFRVAAVPELSGTTFHQIAVDFDSSNAVVANVPIPGPLSTQPEFHSWNASWAFTSLSTTGAKYLSTQFLAEGIEFELTAIRTATGPSVSDTPYLGSRIRSNRGGTVDKLLQDFVFAEGAAGDCLSLAISGLPVGTYRMTTWHYDADLGTSNARHFMQIEVGDQQAGEIISATNVVVDHFPLGSAAQTFEFQVTAGNIAKEIIFRNDDATGINNYRTRFNGFTLVRIPEPSSLLTAAFAIALCFTGRHSTLRSCKC